MNILKKINVKHRKILSRIILFLIVFAIVTSAALFYFRGQIADKESLKTSEGAEVRLLEYLSGTFPRSGFPEPNMPGAALLLFPIYKITGGSLVFFWIVKLWHILSLTLAILILYKIIRSLALSLLLLAYPFTHVFSYHTCFDLLLIVGALYLLFQKRVRCFYLLSLIFPLFRLELILFPIILIFVRKDYRWLWVPFASFLAFLTANYYFYGDPFWYFTVNIAGFHHNFGTTGLVATIAGAIVAVITLFFYLKDAIISFFHIIFQKPHKNAWLSLFAVSSSLVFLYFLLVKHSSSMDRFGFYLLPFIILKLDTIIPCALKKEIP